MNETIKRQIAEIAERREVEQRRKAACFDELVQALGVVRMAAAWHHLTFETQELINAALDKARNV